MANGRPSNRRQISATTSSWSAPSSNEASALRARSRNNATPADPAVDPSRPGTATRCSPSSERPSRLVASTRNIGAILSSSSTRSAAPSRTCSQLSSTTSTRRPDMATPIAFDVIEDNLNERANAGTTPRPSLTSAKSTKTPRSCSRATSPTATPPAYSHATHTDERHQPGGANTVCDLFDQVVTTDQRRQHNGQKAQPPLGRTGRNAPAPTWNIRSGSAKPFSTHSPRSTHSTPSRSARVTAEPRIWPP